MKTRRFLLTLLIGSALTFNVHLDQNFFENGLSVGLTAFAQDPNPNDEDPDEDPGGSGGGKRYATAVCVYYCNGGPMTMYCTGSRCITPDKNGPCDKTSACK